VYLEFPLLGTPSFDLLVGYEYTLRKEGLFTDAVFTKAIPVIREDGSEGLMALAVLLNPVFLCPGKPGRVLLARRSNKVI